MPSSRGSSQPRDRTQVTCLLADSLLPEAPGDLGPTLIQHDLLLTSFHLQKPYFQVRPHLQVLGVRISTYLWGNTAGG